MGGSRRSCRQGLLICLRRAKPGGDLVANSWMIDCCSRVCCKSSKPLCSFGCCCVSDAPLGFCSPAPPVHSSGAGPHFRAVRWSIREGQRAETTDHRVTPGPTRHSHKGLLGSTTVLLPPPTNPQLLAQRFVFRLAGRRACCWPRPPTPSHQPCDGCPLGPGCQRDGCFSV